MAERIRRSVEERVAEIDKKIEAHKSSIVALEAKKQSILSPKPRKRMTKKVKMEILIKEALKQGLELDEIAEKLNVVPILTNGSIDSDTTESDEPDMEDA